MEKTTSDYINPKFKKPVTDKSGHYDIDGVTQAHDFEVIIAGDETSPNKPTKSKKASFKSRFREWLAAWDDEKNHQ